MVNCNSKYEYNLFIVQNADEYNLHNVQKQSVTAEYGPSIENVDAHYHITALQCFLHTILTLIATVFLLFLSSYL